MEITASSSNSNYCNLKKGKVGEEALTKPNRLIISKRYKTSPQTQTYSLCSLQHDQMFPRVAYCTYWVLEPEPLI